MGRKLSQLARSKMVDAAFDICAAFGLEHCTVDHVSKRSGVAKTTIYRHFASGDALLVAAIERMVEKIPDPDTGSFHNDLSVIAQKFVQIASVPYVRRVIASVINRSARDPDFATLHKAIMSGHQAPIRAAVQRGVARGEIEPTIDPELAYLMIEGPFIARLLVEGDSLNPDEVDQLVGLISRSLRPPSSAR